MREIKVQAWAHASRRMFYPNTDDGWVIVNGRLCPLPNTTFREYTGRKDRDNKEIYAEDILSREEKIRNTVYTEYGKIEWYKSSWCVRFIDGEIISLEDYVPETGLICGNMYENSELMEV